MACALCSKVGGPSLCLGFAVWAVPSATLQSTRVKPSCLLEGLPGQCKQVMRPAGAMSLILAGWVSNLKRCSLDRCLH